MLKKGLVQIYTGDGKGKTTAAFGLALRAAGQNNNVLIYQFLKPSSLDIGERKALLSTDLSANIKIETLNVQWDICKSFSDEKILKKTRKAISTVLAKLAQKAEKKDYDLLILDEIVYCLSENLAKLEDVKKIIELKDPAVEIVLTGRSAAKELIEIADLVTEMKKIKHPFDKGIKARKGIEF